MTIPEPVHHVFLHNPRVSQVEAFAEIADQLPDRLYWRLAGHIWRNTGPYFYAVLWHKLLTSPRPHREHFPKWAADRVLWEQMGDAVILFRGYGPESPKGIFFSLSMETAEDFATLPMHAGRGRVEAKLVHKADCIFRGGRQAEVIYLPRLKAVQYSRSI